MSRGYTASPRKRSKRMVLCPHCQAPCVVYVGVYPHTGGTTAYCETHHWLHSYDPRRMSQVQGTLLEEARERVLTEGQEGSR